MKFKLHMKTVKVFVIYAKLEVTKNKITSKNSHQAFIRQEQFKSLLGTFVNNKDQNQEMKDHLKNDKNDHPVALDIYQNVLRHNLHRDAEVRPAGFFIVPNFL